MAQISKLQLRNTVPFKEENDKFYESIDKTECHIVQLQWCGKNYETISSISCLNPKKSKIITLEFTKYNSKIEFSKNFQLFQSRENQISRAEFLINKIITDRIDNNLNYLVKIRAFNYELMEEDNQNRAHSKIQESQKSSPRSTFVTKFRQSLKNTMTGKTTESQGVRRSSLGIKKIVVTPIICPVTKLVLPGFCYQGCMLEIIQQNQKRCENVSKNQTVENNHKIISYQALEKLPMLIQEYPRFLDEKNVEEDKTVIGDDSEVVQYIFRLDEKRKERSDSAVANEPVQLD